MVLSWNEIKSRAVEFSTEWKDDFNEHAEAKSFMDAFLQRVWHFAPTGWDLRTDRQKRRWPTGIHRSGLERQHPDRV